MSSKSRAACSPASGDAIARIPPADNHHSQSKKEFLGMPGFVVDFLSTFPPSGAWCCIAIARFSQPWHPHTCADKSMEMRNKH